MGTVIGPNGRIWYANYSMNKIVKIEPSTVILGEEENILLIGNKIYPNPANNILYFTQYAKSVKIFDINGKLILSENNNVNSIDVSMLDKDIYLIDVDGVQSKFVKK